MADHSTIEWTDATWNPIPGSEWIDRLGKKAAGALLDGREHKEWPR